MTKIQFKNREEKIKFLQGLQDGTRSLEEVIELKQIGLTYAFVNGEILITGTGGKVYTREQAREIRNRTGQDVMIYVPGPHGNPAHLAFEEDAGTNPRHGRHISFVPCDGCAPIEDDDD